MTPAASTLTLQDIADIAHVRRPVVSMWRSREYVNGEHVPFPRAVEVRGDVEHFDRDEVVAWVDRTGRGNNTEFAADARAAAVPADASFDDVVVLLCLAFIAGRPLGDPGPDALIDLADECDPDDLFLFSEVERLADNASTLLHYVDGLRSVAFGPADALERVESSRLARDARATFDAAGVRAFAAVTEAIATHRGNGSGSLADASEGSSGLALDVARTWSEGSCEQLLVEGDSPAARRQRRAALLHGLGSAQGEVDADVSLLAVTAMSPADALRAIDELQLTLSDGVAIVVGPATLLCNTLNDPDLESARDAIVRTGTLRFAARLPRGLWLPAPRQALGMWIFGSQTARRIEDRAVALADLSHEGAAALSVDDLATDAVASLGNLRGRAFRFARVVPTSRLIAAGEIVPPGAHAARHVAPQPAERVVRIESLLDTLSADLPVRQPELVPTGDSSPVADASLGALLDAKALALVRGTRLDISLATADGPVRLLDPSHGDAGCGFDPMILEANHPRATRTEPGDVVFTHTPAPAAYVDVRGGSVVATPARVLQLAPGTPIGPYALARAINRHPAHAREWRAWRIPTVEPAQKPALETELAAIHVLRLELSTRIDRATELADELTDAAAAGAVDLTTAEGTDVPPRKQKEPSTPSTMKELKDTLWKAADKLRGSMDASQYRDVILGLVFLKYVSDAYDERREEIRSDLAAEGFDDDQIADLIDEPEEYQGYGVFVVPARARWEYLAQNAKGLAASMDEQEKNIGQLVDEAMAMVMAANKSLEATLPYVYNKPNVDQRRLGELIDLFNSARFSRNGTHRARDLLGEVYEYFLGNFARAEGKRGGEFYTPQSVVKVLVEVLEPSHGRVYDPCCGSGGMFVQTEKFIHEHEGDPKDVAIYGQESIERTWQMARMNLAIHGIANQGLGASPQDTFARDLHADTKMHFVMANPPFNIKDWTRREDDPRWTYGVPPARNANYAWIQHILSKLAPGGSAGVVMANGSMSSNSNGEGDIRAKIVEADLVSCMVALPTQLFRSTGIPVCLWFFAKDKTAGDGGAVDRTGEVLFVDARELGYMVDRAERSLADEDIAKIADTFHAWRGTRSAAEKALPYEDVPGFCKSVGLADIKAADYALTPGRYVGAPDVEDDGEPIDEKVERLSKELLAQFDESARLEKVVREQLERLDA